MRSLTSRQQEILEFIRQFLEQEGFPPTVAEIMRAMGLKSPHGVREQLQALARKGAIELIPSTSRGIRLLNRAQEDGSWPLIGNDYLLRVQGTSMRDAGILDGDLLVVRHTSEARSGQIVVARIHDEVTVKTLRLADSMAYLEPANPEFPVISVDLAKQDLAIEGVVVGVIRTRIE